MAHYENIESALIHGGIFAGSSSGAAYTAAKKLTAAGVRGNIVVILPDRGDRYFSKRL